MGVQEEVVAEGVDWEGWEAKEEGEGGLEGEMGEDLAARVKGVGWAAVSAVQEGVGEDRAGRGWVGDLVVEWEEMEEAAEVMDCVGGEMGWVAAVGEVD